MKIALRLLKKCERKIGTRKEKVNTSFFNWHNFGYANED